MTRCVRLALCFLMFAVLPVIAQDPPERKVSVDPPEKRWANADDNPARIPGSTVSQPPRRSKKSKFWRAMTCRGEVIDWQFCLAIGFHSFAMTRDAISTRRYLRACPECKESNSWLFGERPTMKRMIGTHAGIITGFGLASYYFKNGMHKDTANNAAYSHAERQGWWLWAVPQVILGSGHLVAAQDNNKFAESKEKECRLAAKPCP